MQCSSCGLQPLPDGTVYCPRCAANLRDGPSSIRGTLTGVSPKSRLVVTLLAAFLGNWGIHRFYLGKIGTGIAMIFTLGGLGIWTLIDFIRAVCGDMTDSDGLRVKNWDT